MYNRNRNSCEHDMKKDIKNKFSIHECSGAFGDIGLLLPMVFAFCIFNGFSAGRIFLLWGIAYIATGYYYKVPVAIQPLKAIAVLAIAGGYLPGQLASTAFFYGVIFIILSLSGILKLIQPIFTLSIVRGVQVGIGLILLDKSVSMVIEKGFFLTWDTISPFLNIGVLLLTAAVLWFFQHRKMFPVTIIIIFGSILVSFLAGITITGDTLPNGPLLTFNVPDWGFFLSALVLLIIPQIPLTIGNAVYAASDMCHHLWKNQAKRVSPSKLGFSIGILNVFIGLFGGFPICHGSSGMAAHHQFGGRTGGTTMIIGVLLVLVAVFTPLSRFIFFIPIPILGALLFITGLKMSFLLKTLPSKKEILITAMAAAISFLTRNLMIAVIAGIATEQLLKIPLPARADKPVKKE